MKFQNLFVKETQRETQYGFALIVVLIVLLMLAGVVASMLRGQTLKLRQTGDYFFMNEANQQSHNAHRECMVVVKNALQSTATGSFNWLVPMKLSDGVSTCTITAISPPSVQNSTPESWSPQLVVTTVANGGFTETSEVSYPSCVNTACTQSAATITLDNNIVVSPLVLVGGAVSIGWR